MMKLVMIFLGWGFFHIKNWIEKSVKKSVKKLVKVGEKIGEKNRWKSVKNSVKKSVKKIGEKFGEKNRWKNRWKNWWKKLMKKIGEKNHFDASTGHQVNLFKGLEFFHTSQHVWGVWKNPKIQSQLAKFGCGIYTQLHTLRGAVTS